jgi:hypothetical protein
VQHRHRVGVEELALAPDTVKPDAQVLGGVFGRERLDAQPRVQPRVEAAVVTPRETVLELGQADKHERKKRPRVPLVVEQDVQVVDDVLVKQVRLVEEEDRVQPPLTEVLDVRGDGEEDRCRSG